ncbi:hypothetical protein TNCV_2321541 [Trichonephila clavipes]|nr:hypothetical protein TNCV_2321541 [Trichonephila clavipes]
MVKVTDSYLTCHEFDPSTTEDPPSEHNGMAFTPRVTLPGENSPDVLHPYRPDTPVHLFEATDRTLVFINE